MKRLILSGLAIGALVVGLAVPPAQAAPAPGVFAPSLELATGVIPFGPAAAALKILTSVHDTDCETGTPQPERTVDVKVTG